MSYSMLLNFWLRCNNEDCYYDDEGDVNREIDDGDDDDVDKRKL